MDLLHHKSAMLKINAQWPNLREYNGQWGQGIPSCVPKTLTEIKIELKFISLENTGDENT